MKAIIDWPTLVSVGEVRSCHGLASFHRNFISNFNSICSLVIEAMRGDNIEYKWIGVTQNIFKFLKQNLIE